MAADLPLHDLAQRLAQKQAELAEARHAYDARLADLTRRKDELQAQLRAVDAEIEQASAPAPPTVTPPQAQTPKSVPEAKKAAASSKAATTTPSTAQPVAQQGAVSLRELRTRLLAPSKRPLKAKELAEQALAAGYQTTSKD